MRWEWNGWDVCMYGASDGLDVCMVGSGIGGMYSASI